MSDKKHIDRLFQEKLKNFEASPSDAVWNNINSQLQQNGKERKVIPLWIRVAGVAAVLLLLVTIGSSILSGSDEAVPETIVGTENIESGNNNNTGVTKDSNEGNEQPQIANQEDALEKKNIETPTSGSNTPLQKTDEIVVPEDLGVEEAIAKQDHYQPSKKTQNIEGAVVNTEVSNLSQNKSDQNNLDQQKFNEITNTIQSDNSVVNTELEAKELNNLELQQNDIESENSDKPSIDEAISEAEALKPEKDKERDKWSIAPHIAPVYFNTLGSGSAVDAQFNNNPTSGDVNLSYGVVANYHINDKLSIRGGINKMDLGYSINNVVVYNNIDDTVDDTNPLRNVQLNAYGQTLSFLSSEGLNFAQVPGVVADNIQSSIDQDFSYIEVPLELEYRLTDSKFNVSVIGGLSTLFLTDNAVYTTLQGEQRELGEATNINSTSFSANFGVGLNYNVSKQINLNLEPMFKYQLNTFNDTSGNFNPYVIGVYTGFTFKF